MLCLGILSKHIISITIDIILKMIDQWHDFFIMVVGGAAALTGLVFVAMSLKNQSDNLPFYLVYDIILYFY